MDPRILCWLKGNQNKWFESPRKDAFNSRRVPDDFMITGIDESDREVSIRFRKGASNALPLPFWMFIRAIQHFQTVKGFVPIGAALSPPYIKTSVEEAIWKSPLPTGGTEYKSSPHVCDILALMNQAEYGPARNPDSGRRVQGVRWIGGPIAASPPRAQKRGKTPEKEEMTWTATMKSFSDDTQLMIWAQKFIGEKLSSLERDVNICMGSYPDAPFPAMLYCFSVIDMLGSLYCGEAHSNLRNTSKNSGTYMKEMMGYSQDDCNFIQKIFRHKLVHLAGPNSVFKNNEDRITWNYARDLPERHLNLKSVPPGGHLAPENTRIIHKVSHTFWISLEKLVEDIKQSVQKPDGYISKLETDSTLREKLDDAVWDMFSPSG